MILLEVVQYLLLHGADSFVMKCTKTGKTAHQMAMDNYNKCKDKDESIEKKIIDILKGTKQIFFHPVIRSRNSHDNR